MSETASKSKEKESKRGNKIEDYLTGPREKNKNYVVFAMSPGLDRDLAVNIVQATQKLFPQMSIAVPRNLDELSRHFTRVISLLVVDDEFEDTLTVLRMVKILKETRHKDMIPVLFLTRNASRLIELYQQELALYQEVDEYVEILGVGLNKIMARVKVGIEEKNRRRSRRYQTDIEAKFFHLGKNLWFQGRLVDLSLHGAILEANPESGLIFRKGEQVKIVIPITEQFDLKLGEFMKLSARAQRVMISGTRIAISFEHVTTNQHNMLSRYLSHYVNKQMSRQAKGLRAKLARGPQMG